MSNLYVLSNRSSLTGLSLSAGMSAASPAIYTESFAIDWPLRTR